VERKRRTHDSKRYNKPDYELNVKNVYILNRYRDKRNNNITYIHFVPERGHITMLVKNLSVKCKQPKKDSFHRYYVKNIDSIEIEKKKNTVIKKTNKKEALKQDDEANEIASWCKNLQEEQKCRTRECNEQLTEDARNLNFGCNILTFRYLKKKLSI